MFTFANAHTDNGSGSATEDEIVRDTGRAMGQIMAAARAFIHSRTGRPGKAKAPKLSRKDRRDLAEALRAQVGEQKIAEAWYTKRVNDYHAEVVASNLRSEQPGFTAAERQNDQDRLAGIRYSIESTLHEQQSLPLERRGQVAMALSTADRNPDRPYGAIFKPMDREQERVARSVAVQSETWVAGRRDDNVRLVEEQRARAAKLAEDRREARPPRDYDELTKSQRDAVQLLRATQLGVDRVGERLPADRVEAEQERAKYEARNMGLTNREIGHQLDYMAEHTGYVASYGDDKIQVQNFYPSREEATAEIRREMVRDRQLGEKNVWVNVRARENGLAAMDPEKRGSYGPRNEVIAAVSRWEREPETEHVGRGEVHEVAVARIEPGTGRVEHSESATLVSEQAALDFAHRGVTSAGSSVARMRVEVTDPQRPETPRYHDYGCLLYTSD
ncbi:hypothetical protein, partial [Streptomyces sp. NPDC058664]|uniref:hypothetical protein n=1 Tax=Streptomyces sp. NPDC058664 TaxID=3346585 RepID=UPI003650CB68